MQRRPSWAARGWRSTWPGGFDATEARPPDRHLRRQVRERYAPRAGKAGAWTAGLHTTRVS